ncbi:MAG TPA: amidohydrolase family protein [Steroidobacteraceae bacterium]|jgi:cytosine/adenosine deaminase-related metal-dependent hydrolase
MLALINADVEGRRTQVRIGGSRIASVGEPPEAHDRVLDLAGDRLLPGLINAHDHLPLNHLPRLEPAPRYQNVREWIAAVDRRRRVDGPLKAAVAVPMAERLLLGGVKNLLSGVTTVAHHDPLYPDLCEIQYPVRVVRRYGWAHSLYVEGEAKTLESQRRTPADWPWIIHAAEGLDEGAREEFWRLDRLGCLKANTLIVHGVALGGPERRRLSAASAGLIWCPASNLHLFGATAEVAELAREGRVAIGTDSRLTGSRDLLEELHIAAQQVALNPSELESLVTRDAARLLHLPDCGIVAPGARADLLVLPQGVALEGVHRADIRLVMVDGIPLYGDLDVAGSLAGAARWVEVHVDGRVKALEASLAERLRRLASREPGLELAAATGRAA